MPGCTCSTGNIENKVNAEPIPDRVNTNANASLVHGIVLGNKIGMQAKASWLAGKILSIWSILEVLQ